MTLLSKFQTCSKDAVFLQSRVVLAKCHDSDLGNVKLKVWK